jgi:hypothetical protein
MSASKGKDGGFYLGSTLVTFMDTWSLNRGVTVEETTSFGDDWETRCATVKNWGATFGGSLDRSDAQQASLLDQLEDGVIADVVVRLGVSSSEYWVGSAIVESDTINSGSKGVVKYTGNLSGNGELSWVE